MRQIDETACRSRKSTIVQLKKRRFFKTTLAAFIAGCGVLTGTRVRDITTSSSWRPASVDTEYGTKLPKNPAIMGLSEQNDM